MRLFRVAALVTASVAAFLALPSRAQDNCESIRREVVDAARLLKEVIGFGDRKLIAAAEAKYERLKKEWEDCLHPPPPPPKPPCDDEKRQYEKARNAWAEAMPDKSKEEALVPVLSAARRKYCDCLEKKGMPLPELCKFAGPADAPLGEGPPPAKPKPPPPPPPKIAPPPPPVLTPTPPFPGPEGKSCEDLQRELWRAAEGLEEAVASGKQDRIAKAEAGYREAKGRWEECLKPPAKAEPPPPPCDAERKRYEEARQAWAKGFSDPKKGAELRDAREARLQELCECLRKKNLPLPDGCGPKGPQMPLGESPPPPPKVASPPPPPPSAYVCGKSPCDCAKQNPPKKCTTSSGCVCTKG